VDLADRLNQALVPGSAAAGDASLGVEAEVIDVDRLGVLVRRLRVWRADRTLDQAVSAVPEALRSATRQDFVVTESDASLGGAVARTAVEGREFYELHITGAEATLERWRVGNDGRDSVAWPLTREDLGRVVRALGAEGRPRD